MFFAEFNSSDGGSHTAHFLGLEFDSLLHFLNFGSDLFALSQVDRETTHLDQDITQKFRDLLTN